MAHELVLRGGLQIIPTPGSGTGDPQLTLGTSTKIVHEVPAVDSSTFISKTLATGNILVGNNTNIATAVSVTGVISLSSGGVTTLQAGVVFDSNVNASAGITYSKLNLAGGIVNADINASAAITRTKLATGTAYRLVVNNSSGIISELSALTAAKVLVSDANGQPITANPSTTEINFVAGVTSAIQTQLGNRLSFSSAITPVTGDLIIYTGGVWTRLPIGTTGQTLSVSGGLPAWGSAVANGLPTGGTTGQYLNKIDGTNYNTQWSTLTLAKITDVTSSAAEVNKLTGVTTTAAQFNYLNTASSDVQAQINNRLLNVLANNAIFVGNPFNLPSQLAVGTNGQVLSVVAGVPQWQTITGTGTVTSVAVSGGTTGLTTSGGPITTTGTITFAGILIPANGGTGFASYTIGDLLYADTTTTLAKRIAVATGSVLGSAGAATAPAYLAVSNGLTATATTFKLGGSLTADTSINGAFNINFGNVTPVQSFNVYDNSGSNFFLGGNFGVSTGANSIILIGATIRLLPTVAPVVGQIPVATNVNGTWTWQTGPYWPLTGSATLTGNVTVSGPNHTYSVTIGSFGSFLSAFTIGSDSISLKESSGTSELDLNSTGITFKVNGSSTTGDTYYQDSFAKFNRLAIGGTSSFLTVVGGIPAWSTYGISLGGGLTTAGNVTIPADAVGVLTNNGSGILTWAASGGGSTVYTLNPQGASYTFVLGDATTQTLVQATSASATNFTIPPNASVAYPVGSVLSMVWDGVGQPTWVAGAGVTINSSSNSLVVPSRYTTSVAVKAATNTWYLLNGVPGNPFSDATALVMNAADNTKLLKLSASSITTGTTRTWTFPDVNGIVARNDAAQSFIGRQTFDSITITQNVLTTSGGSNALLVTTGAHTNLTLSVELLAVNINTSATVQYAAGAQSILRNFLVQAPTIGFVGASTVTNSATFTIDGPSKAGTNATLSSSAGLWIQGSTLTSGVNVGVGLKIDGSIGATNNYALQITEGAATSGQMLGFVLTGAVQTGLGTNSHDVFLNLSRAVQFVTGSVASLSSFLMTQPSAYSFVGASTITDVASINLTGAIAAGTNGIFTNSHSLLINSSAVNGGGTVTNSYGLTVNAQTGATNNFSAQFLGGLGVKFAQTAQTVSHTFIDIQQSAHTGGTPTAMVITGGAHTTLAASTTAFDINFNLARTVQFATGAITAQYVIQLSSPTYGFVGASTITTAAGFAFNNATPSAGTNATITNSHAILVVASTITGTVTNSYGLTVNAASGAATNYVAQFLGGNVGIGISAPVSTLDILGSLGTKIRTITTSTTAAATDHTLLCDSTSGVIAVTLPTASGATGRIYVVKKIDASANNVTLATVDGGTKTITIRYAGFAVQSDGSLWYVIGSF